MESILQKVGNKAKDFQGELIELKDVNHYVYQIKLNSGKWLILSMQNEILEDNESDKLVVDINDDDEGPDISLPTLEEYMSEPTKYNAFKAEAQFRKQFPDLDKKIPAKVEQKSADPGRSGELQACLSQEVGLSND